MDDKYACDDHADAEWLDDTTASPDERAVAFAVIVANRQTLIGARQATQRRQRMASVKCSVSFEDIVNDSGRTVPGVMATCGRCGHSTTSSGQGEGSIRRCLVLLKESCPNGERNYYAADGDGNSVRAPARTQRPAPTNAPAMMPPVQTQPQVPRPDGAQTLPYRPLFAQPPGFTPPPAHAPTAASSSATTTQNRIGDLRRFERSAHPDVPALIRSNDFAVIKVATTGRKVETDEVCQVSVVLVDAGAPSWRMTINVRPNVEFHEAASAHHGITDARVFLSPTFGEIAEPLRALIGDRVVVGFNARDFDVAILTRQFATAGITWQPRVLDVCEIDRKLRPTPENAYERVKHTFQAACAAWHAPEIDTTGDTLNYVRCVWTIFWGMCTTSRLGDMRLEDL